MSQLGVTAIRWNSDHSEVSYCFVHKVERQDNGFVLLEGKPMPFSDVASLIVAGDKVLVMEKCISGEYEKRDAVCIRSGPTEYLYSSPQNSLFDLPEF